MAEVRKKEVDDKYNTSSIKVKETKKEKNIEKIEKSNNKSKKNNDEKKGFVTKFLIFCNGVKEEFKKVHWTSKNDMVKYSIACICFIVFCALFFFGINKLFIFIQGLFA